MTEGGHTLGAPESDPGAVVPGDGEVGVCTWGSVERCSAPGLPLLQAASKSTRTMPRAAAGARRSDIVADLTSAGTVARVPVWLTDVEYRTLSGMRPTHTRW